MLIFPHILAAFAPFRAPDGAGAGAPADPAAAAGAPPAAPGAGDTAPAAKWHEGLPEDLKTFVTAKGLVADDPAAVLPKVLGIARAAEQRIGKGLDRIIERPAEGQAWSEWARANAKALGLPEAEDGYTVARPEGWPKDAPWNEDMAKAAQKIAFDHGLPPTALQAFTDLYAGQVAQMNAAVDQQMEAARSAMMADLQRDWGADMPGKLALAQQGAKALAQAAGLGDDAMELFAAALAPKVGDAAVMRMMAAVGGMLAEDSAPGLGKGGGLGMSAAEAQATLQREFIAADSAFAKAMREGDRATLERLKPEYERLNRIAAGR